MAITIFIPTPLRPYCDNQDEVTVDQEGSIADVFDALVGRYPGLKQHLFNEENELRKFVNIYLNDEDIRYQGGTESAVKDGDKVSIVPSIAGGV